jgi:hypothetical protein
LTDQVLVDRLQWEMAEWEVHALRGLVTVLVVRAQVLARTQPPEVPDARAYAKWCVAQKERFNARQLQALADPIRRRKLL